MIARTSRALALLGAAFATAGVVAARAAPPAPAPPEPSYLPEGGLMPARHNEILVTVGSYLTGINSPAQRSEPHIRLGLGLEVVPFVPRQAQWLRFAVYGTGTFGGWGAGDHLFTVEGGGKLRISVLPSEVVDFYPLLGGGVLYGTRDQKLGARVALGGGVRVLEAILAEFSFDHVRAVGEPFFDGTPYARRYANGVSLIVGFDFCALGTFCDYARPKQAKDDRTCCTYREAAGVCSFTGKGDGKALRAPLCEAARLALDPVKNAPDDGADPFTVYIARVQRELEAEGALPPGKPRDELLARLASLRATHDAFAAWRALGRAEERRGAQLGRTVATKRVYAPYPTELTSALGCDASAACEDVCDHEPTKEACELPPR